MPINSKIFHRIDILQQECCQENFTNLLDEITTLYEGVDCLCYLLPEDNGEIYINGSLNTERFKNKHIKDGASLSKLVRKNNLPLHTSCKIDDINLATKTGYFLSLPILNQKMDIRGTLIFYSKTSKILKEQENEMIAIAVALSSLVKCQTLPQLITDTAQKQKTKNNKHRKNTVAYRKDVEKPLYNYKLQSTHIMGIAFGDGIGIGQAVLHGSPSNIKHYAAKFSIKGEINTLNTAIDNVKDNIADTLEKHQYHLSQEAVDCLEMHKLLLQDKTWIEQILIGINYGFSASAAVEYARQKMFFSLSAIADPYIRERFSDIADLSDKLRLALTDTDKQKIITNNIILVANSLGVSSLMEYDMNNIKGIILETGNISSHIAIIANSMNIPMLGQCTDTMQYIHPNDKIIIDSDQSVAFVEPEPHTLRLYQRKQRQIKQREKYRKIATKNMSGKTLTKDKIEISLQMNAGLLSEIPLLHDYVADGIGLFRTELTFMGWTKYPTVAKQTEVYEKVLEQAGRDKPVIFRTLDIGGDKPLPYFDAPEEENPALGWRAIRIGIDRPAVLRTQLTALLKAASHAKKPLYVMVPLVAEVAEIIHVRNMLHMTAQRLEKSGEPLPPDIKMGIMLEVPSLLWQLDDVCNVVDFISVGTNDLMQYMFAADRGSAQLHNRYDIISPAMLRALKHIIDTCNRHKTPVNICGEAASLPLEAMALIALGYRSLSMPGARIPLIRNMCQTLDTRALAPYLKQIMCYDDHTLRFELQSFAKDHNINVT